MLLITCLLVPPPAHAQWHRAGRMLSRQAGTRNLAKQRRLNQQLTQATTQATHVQRALFGLRAPFAQSAGGKEITFKATGFALEEVYQGKKYFWGVTASHYDFDAPLLELNGKMIHLVLFTAQGSKLLNDVSVFPLPENIARQLTPLHLADTPPQTGDPLYSGGFFADGQFHYEGNRVLKEMYPHRMITTLQVEPGPYREGACGSPLLNKQGQVVGMHIGSSQHEQIGYAVTLKDIRALLNAQHQKNLPTEPLLLHGKRIGQLHVNEGISLIETFRANQLLGRVRIYHMEKEVDYNHLENLIDVFGADRIIFYIERNHFSMYEDGPMFQYFSLTYDIHTGQSTLKQGW